MDWGSGIMAVSMGIALSACCGFRVFLPLLIAGVASKAGWINSSELVPWLGSWPAILCFGVAAAAELTAYYLPVVDNFLDLIATPLAVAAGSLLAASFLPLGDWDPLLKWGLGILAGGGMAGTIQLGTGALRLVSTKTTAGTGNALVATVEHLAAGVGSILSLFIPIIMAVLALILVIFVLYRLLIRLNR